jgi:hypothetical protein
MKRKNTLRNHTSTPDKYEQYFDKDLPVSNLSGSSSGSIDWLKKLLQQENFDELIS